MYREIKSVPMAEPYVKCGLAVGVRRVIAGLRAG